VVVISVGGTVVIFDQRGFGRFNAADVKAQLKLRKVPFKQTDKLGVLEELWKKYDASHKNLSDAIAVGGRGHGVDIAAGGVAGGGNSGAVAAAVAPAAAEAVHLPADAAHNAQVAPAAAAAKGKCAVCNEFGQRADNKRFHPY
jgi:hypothetical protein